MKLHHVTRDHESETISEATPPDQPKPTTGEHKSGCPAMGGYGHGAEPCICGADKPSTCEWTVERLEDYLGKGNAGNMAVLAYAINAALADERELLGRQIDATAAARLRAREAEKQLSAEREDNNRLKQQYELTSLDCSNTRKREQQLREQLAACQAQLHLAGLPFKHDTAALDAAIAEAVKKARAELWQSVTSEGAKAVFDKELSEATKPLVDSLKSYEYDSNGHIVTWLSAAAHKDALEKVKEVK